MKRLVLVPASVATLLATGATSFFVASLFLGFPRSSLALDPRAAECGEVVRGAIRTQIELEAASDYRTIFPKMGRSPELEDSSPAFFVVYDGQVEIFSLFGAYPALDATEAEIEEWANMREAQHTGVICAITKYGRIVYTDVDTSD